VKVQFRTLSASDMHTSFHRIALFLLAILPGCHRSNVPNVPVDRSFCAISAQKGKPTPSIAEVDNLGGRYSVALYSADSGKVLDRLDISLSPTDTLHRFYQQVYDAGKPSHWERRKEPVLAFGDERRLKSRQRPRWPSVSLYYSDKPVISVFPPPRCFKGGCTVPGMRVGLFLNIKQVTPAGFAGTVDQVGTVTSMHVAGQPPQFLGPHYFCAVKEQ